MTPLKSEVLIDGDAVRRIVEEEYRNAGFTPADIDTGAVIITGESALKENANIVLEKLSSLAGEFVVSTAGPDLEAIIAGKGSGAQQYSIDKSCIVANLDIGGGTTNVVVFDNGEVVSKGCYDIGGRLIRIENGIVSYASPKAVLAAADIGIKREVNRKISPDDLSRITDRMNSVLEQVVGLSQPDELEKALRTPGSSKFEAPKRINHIFFSGGVADFIYHDSEGDLFPYGDIGFLLGRSIKRGKITKNINTCRPSETIRATVVGAGTYTTTISGSTITYTDDIFPVKNVPVLVLKDYIEKRCISQDGEMLVKEIKWFQKQCGREDIIIGLKGQSNLGYSDLRKLAENISEAALETMNKNIPIIIVVETDVAKALGQAIDIYLKGSRRVVCIDNIKVSQGDYVDMGKPLFGGIAVPVVVKTLIFG
jgi:ethanolamine utilization protein EutA